MKEKILVGKLVKDLNYCILDGFECLEKEIVSSHITLPGLELTGYLKFYNNNSAVLLGENEISYLKSLDEEKEEEALKGILSESTPFVLVCENSKCSNNLVEYCRNLGIALIGSKKHSLTVFNEIYSYLIERLSKKEMVHGTLLEIFGNGVLLKGSSGIGKSEIGLELVKRGHKLVADDSVITFKRGTSLIGKSVDHLKNIMEVRGLGFINVYRLFGLSAVSNETEISYIINLVPYDDIKENDRIFDTVGYEEINGVKLASIKLPVSSGRSIADIVEVSILELSSRKLGYNTTNEFISRYDKMIKEEK